MSNVKEIYNKIYDCKNSILKEIEKVIIGQKQVVEELLIVLFSGGHCVIEGVPGLAKTLMISSLSELMHLKFKRIQFTPDLMPSDITGTDILAENKSDGKKYFQFIKGPVFSNIILADEINRTPPKTQAALLQAMQENEVTIGNETFKLDKPFIVLATQNPIEQEGTYPLPEAQLDRFMFQIKINYPTFEEEIAIVNSTTSGAEEKIKAVVSAEDILKYQQAIRELPVSEHVVDFAVRLVRSTRPSSEQCPEKLRKFISWGAGPRASQFLIAGAKTKAALDDRLSPSVDDIKKIAHLVLRHRIIITFAAEAEGLSKEEIINDLLTEAEKNQRK